MPSSHGSSTDSQTSRHKIRSNSISSTSTSTSTRAQRRGSRTTNACEACKRRKTKCTGPPEQCEACHKADTFCHFNLKLDTRRKQAYKQDAVRTRQQYILEAVLQILKHSDSHDVQVLLRLIRHEGRPQEIASSLRHSIRALQQRGLLKSLDIDENDIMSLGLQSLFSHRARRPDSKSQPIQRINQLLDLSEGFDRSRQPSISPSQSASSIVSPVTWLNDRTHNNQLDFSNSFEQRDVGHCMDTFNPISMPFGILPNHLHQPQFDYAIQNSMVDLSSFPFVA